MKNSVIVAYMKTKNGYLRNVTSGTRFTAVFANVGSAKTQKFTTIDTLCTLMDFDSGNVTIDGYDLCQEAKAIL